MSHPHGTDDHDLGLQHDLERMAAQTMARRRALSIFGAAAAVPLLGTGLLAQPGRGGQGRGGPGQGGGGSSSSSSSSASSSSSTSSSSASSGCTNLPEETAGPYPSDGSNSANGTLSNVLTQSGIVRTDIRSSFGSYSGTAAGVPLSLTLQLANSSASCAALAGYAVYLWHCDRDGSYSLYTVPAANYLRGVGVTDANGQVTFTTIFPACYSGRWPHIHFEVYRSLSAATSYRNKLLTSQLALPQAIASSVYNSATGYSASVTNLAKISLSSDNVFGDNTAAQIAAMTPTMAGSVSAGFNGLATIGIAA